MMGSVFQYVTIGRSTGSYIGGGEYSAECRAGESILKRKVGDKGKAAIVERTALPQKTGNVLITAELCFSRATRMGTEDRAAR